VLISNINTTSDPEENNYLTKMKVAYDKCMNASEHEELGDQPLAQVLEEIGGWPVVTGTEWSESNFSLAEVLAKLKDTGYDHDFFAKIEVAPHVLAHKYNLIYIGTSDLGLDDRSYYLDKAYSSTMDAYRKFMLSAAKELGSKLDADEIRRQMDDVLAFEKEIAQVMFVLILILRKIH
jgi:predicted metalloendopeptidase